MKVGVERRSSVTFSPLWGGDTHLFLLFDSIHSLLGLFAKLTWGCVLSFPNQSPDFALESFLFFSVFYPPWDEAFVDSLCIRKNGDVKKKKKNGGVSNWKTCLNLFQTLSDSKPFWLPDPRVFYKVWSPDAVSSVLASCPWHSQTLSPWSPLTSCTSQLSKC